MQANGTAGTSVRSLTRRFRIEGLGIVVIDFSVFRKGGRGVANTQLSVLLDLFLGCRLTDYGSRK